MPARPPQLVSYDNEIEYHHTYFTVFLQQYPLSNQKLQSSMQHILVFQLLPLPITSTLQAGPCRLARA